jgi:hypothetical protein
LSRGEAGRQAETTRRNQILIVLAVLLALAGALAAWLLYPKGAPDPSFVALVIDQYDDLRIPPNPWAARDRVALRDLEWKGRDAFTKQHRDLLVQELRDLGKGLPEDQPLVVYLCAYAVATEDGVALLPGDARLDDPTSWLPVKTVLQHVRACRLRHKLLLLDLAAPLADARAGVLSDDVASRLDDLLKAGEDDERLHVLCSCAPGQFSLASEDAGHRVFVDYLLRGLRGRADGFESGRTDGRVSVRELAGYVAAAVDRWAWHNRRARQTPVLYGSGEDYSLLAVGKETDDDFTPEKKYPVWLEEGWKERDAWLNDRVAPAPPDLVARLEVVLLRAEERWRGGVRPEEIQSDLGPRLESLREERKKRAGTPYRGEPRSLAEAVARGAKPPEGRISEALERLKDLAAWYARARAPKPAENAKETLTAQTEKLVKPFKDKPFDLAWTVFHAAEADADPRPERLACWSELLYPEEQPGPNYAETRLLRQLAGLKADKPEAWPAADVRVALTLAALAAEVETLSLSPWPWLAKKREDAAGRREKAQEALLSADPNQRARVGPALKGAFADYQQILDLARPLAEARRSLDEAHVLLPGFGHYLETEEGGAAMADWEQAARTAGRLQDSLARAEKSPPADDLLRDLRSQAEEMRDSLKKLRRPFNPESLERRIAQSRQEEGADPRELEVLFRLPGLAAKDRIALWSAWRDLAGRLQGQTRQAEEGKRSLNNPGRFNAAGGREAERNRALLRARVALALLRLEKAPGADSVATALNVVERSPKDSNSWRELRQALSRAWAGLESSRGRGDAN